jgi:Predicted rRNA methylase
MLPEALAKVWPLNTAHKRSLPDDVAQLSRLLTTERAGLARPYWSSPASISAYLYYFLPWNLVRLTRLLASLPLADPRAVAPQGGEALLVDVGSGPLTLPLALWLARPEWRSAPVRVLAMDTSSQPLELGKTLMEVLGELTGQPVWPVRVARAPLDQVVRQAAPLLSGGRARPWLVSAANVLNELRFGKKRSRGASAIEDEDEFDSLDAEGMDIDGNPAAGEADGEKPEGCREDRLDSFLESLSPLFDHADSRGEATAGSPASVGPSLLFVEPGTRLGGSTIMRLRQLAVDGGLTALAPCTHQADCPLLRGQGGRTWCHFTFGSEGAPLWLEDLSQASGLGKSGLSLSPLLLAAMPEAEAQTSGSLPVRVLSAPFLVPGLAGRARYACSGKGILLLENAECLASGDELTVSIAAGAPLDRKSGALQVSPPAQQGGTPRPERRPGADEQGRRPVPYNRDNREGGRGWNP